MIIRSAGARNALTGIAMLLAFATWAAALLGIQNTERHEGPFAADGQSAMYATPLQSLGVLSCCLERHSDLSSGNGSALIATLNGRPLGPAHQMHDALRGGAPGLSHWGDYLYFTPAQGENVGPGARLEITYPVRPTRLLLLATTLLALALLLGLHGQDLLRWVRSGGAHRQLTARGASNILFYVLGAAAAATLLLDWGVLQRNETIRGPFTADAAPGAVSFYVTPSQARSGCCLRARSDADGGSDMRLWINGAEITQAHAMHSTVRSGELSFSHWGDVVLFALPAGTENSPTTTVELRYSIKPPAMAAGVMTLLFVVLGALLHWRSLLAWRRGETPGKASLASVAYGTLGIAAGALLLGSVVYWLWVIGALFSGHHVALSAPFQGEIGAAIFAAGEPVVFRAMLLLSVLAAAAIWLLGPTARLKVATYEQLAERWFGRLGPFVIITLVIAGVGASWAGVERYTASTLAGLVPFFDPVGYYYDLHVFAETGRWETVSANRPLATAVRTSLGYISGLSYPALVTWQAALTALGIFWATLSVLRWRGAWAAMCMFAFTYIQTSTQVSTMMTEPMALIFALFAVPFFVGALQHGSRSQAAIAIALATIAIWIRPGAVFTLPALALWFAFIYGRTWVQRGIGFTIACSIVGGALAVNAVLGNMYAEGAINNFAYTLCGLSRGEVWNGCLVAYGAEMQRAGLTTEYEITDWLMDRAIANISSNPWPLISTMLEMPVRFLRDVPLAMIGGYDTRPMPSWFPVVLYLLGMLAVGAVGLRQRNLRREGWFWGLMIASVLASTALTYMSDGRRVFVVSYIFLALFAAQMLALPSGAKEVSNDLRTHRRRTYLGLGLATLTLAGVFIVPMAGRALVHPPSPTSEALEVRPWPYATGFVVVADGEPLPTSAPAMHLSRFQRAFELSLLDQYQPFFIDDEPTPPFAVAVMPASGETAAMNTYFGPAEVLTQRTHLWRLEVAARTPQNMWTPIVRATPLQPAERRTSEPQ